MILVVSCQLSAGSCQRAVVSGQLSAGSCQWAVVSGQFAVCVPLSLKSLVLHHLSVRGPTNESGCFQHRRFRGRHHRRW
jgi:hypothetical protein